MTAARPTEDDYGWFAEVLAYNGKTPEQARDILARLSRAARELDPSGQSFDQVMACLIGVLDIEWPPIKFGAT